MNKIWIWIIIFSVVVGILNGESQAMTSCLFDSASSTVETCINVFGVMSLWAGIMKLAELSGFINKLQILVRPFMKILFPEVSKNSPALSLIAMNMTANLIGIGNIATPLGIKAMKELQDENPNKKKLSKPMMTFIILNTASIELIPSTVLALRTAFGSENPAEIVFPVLIASFVSAIAGVVLVRCLCK